MLCVAADRVNPDVVNFMASSGRGLICLVMTEERMRRLGIPLLAPDTGHGQPAFGASIEARDGVTTGISAADRAKTILAAVAEDAEADSIVMPGHIFPIQARPGGVLVRAGLVEGAMEWSWMLLGFSSLSFLGFGISPPNADWGLMVADARLYLQLAPWTVLPPMVALASLIIGINLTADALGKALGIDRAQKAPL